MSRSNTGLKRQSSSTGKTGASTPPAGDKPAVKRPSSTEEWVDQLVESDRRMARDPTYRKKIIDRTF